MLTLPLLAVLRSEGTAHQRTLTFDERVSYQRAIEEVYWRHRIWPSERKDPKPSLDAVISQAQLEKKVADYLRNSQALEVNWQRSISAEQLQAEMDRMAKHTKQPEVLRELFDALGNDPFLIAECLARPALGERLTANFSLREKTGRFRPDGVEGLHVGSIVTTVRDAAYNLPTISEGDPPCTDDSWTATSNTNAPTPREFHTAVWTGSEMIVWGGLYQCCTLNDGGRYNPATDSWTATSTANAPSARYFHTAVWTGSEMIVWGGENNGGVFNTGGRYDPGTDTWVATSTDDAPPAREFHTAVWTGSDMIVWGGYDRGQLNTGGRYNPGTDGWTATSTINTPEARWEHTAVWTGSEMIVWGGYNFSTYLNSGGRYNPTTNSWTATSTTNAPAGRWFHTAIWTDSEMIIWGGENNGSLFNTGGRYDPGTDNWVATSTNNAPTPREFHTAIWSDSEMIVWSGYDGFSNLKTGEIYRTQTGTPTSSPTPTPTVPPTPSPGTGGKYDPITDSWIATSTTNAPLERQGHAAVWSGSEMTVWGGTNSNGFLNTGGRYCAQFTLPTPTPTATPRITPRPRLTPHPRP